MDNIQGLLKEIKQDKTIWINTKNMPIDFTAKLLNTVGDVFERYGSGTTRVFLMDKQSRFELRDQATALLVVLTKLEHCSDIINQRAIGRQIFKTLRSLKYTEV